MGKLWFAAACLFLLLLPAAAEAADGGYVELPTHWRFTTTDDMAFAAEDFDDSGWKQTELARRGARTPERPEGAFVWYRAEIRDVSFTGDVALSIGRTVGAYEVYVDGVRIGGGGDIESQQFAPVSAVAHPVPASALEDGKLVLAVRTWLPPGMSRLPLGERLKSPPRILGSSGAVSLIIEHDTLLVFRNWTVHRLLIAVIELLLCLYHFRLQRRRPELSNYFWYAASVGAAALFDGFEAMVSGTLAGFVTPDVYVHGGPLTGALSFVLMIEFMVRFSSEARPSSSWRGWQALLVLLGLVMAGLGTRAYTFLPWWTWHALFGLTELLLLIYVVRLALSKRASNAKPLCWALGLSVAFFVVTMSVPVLNFLINYSSGFLNVAIAVVLVNHYGSTWDKLRSTNRAIMRFVPSPFLELLGKRSITEVGQRGPEGGRSRDFVLGHSRLHDHG